MKVKSIFSGILIPVLAALLLFPPLSCGIFYVSAGHYAETEAEDNLIKLRENVVSIMFKTFSADDATTPKEKVGSFVRSVNPIVRAADGDTRLMIFASNEVVVYPRDHEERTAIKEVSDAFADYLANEYEKLSEEQNTVRIKTKEDESFLANIYIPPIHAREIEYIITYCPVARIESWTVRASVLVLLISAISAAAVGVLLWAAARHISDQFDILCSEAKRIGGGDFKHIDKSFDLKEAEVLKCSMDAMSDMLENTRENQNKFLQNVSHDLRTPLMSIGGYAQGIETGVLNDYMSAAHVISEESARLTKYIGDLMTLSRLENGESFELENVNINECLSDVYEHMNGIAVKNGIVLDIMPTDPSLMVYADQSQLIRIIENLVSNALRYAESWVLVKAERIYDEDNTKIRISVEDDGCGIADKDLAHIFERCYKGEKGGFGFGLAIAYNAAKNMNSELNASNRPDGGAVFVLNFADVMHTLNK